MRISDWSSDVCSSDLYGRPRTRPWGRGARRAGTGWRRRSAGLACPIPPQASRSIPICPCAPLLPGWFGHPHGWRGAILGAAGGGGKGRLALAGEAERGHAAARRAVLARAKVRSEEHTSELQSLMRISYAVFCLKQK